MHICITFSNKNKKIVKSSISSSLNTYKYRYFKFAIQVIVERRQHNEADRIKVK